MIRQAFECCIEIMETLQPKELISSSIIRKTGTNNVVLNRYLGFLASKNYVGSKAPQRASSFNKPPDRIYFLEGEGREFLRRWYKFRKDYKIDMLEKQL
jgi:hypothetical protein